MSESYSDVIKRNQGFVDQLATRAPAPVQAPATSNPRKAMDELRGRQLDAQNDVTASLTREGEAKAGAAQQSAALLGDESARERKLADSAEANDAENDVERKEVKAMTAKAMRKLQEPPVEPEAWQKTVGILSGIVGATAMGYLGPAGGGIAYGMQALQDHVYKSVNDQLQAKAQAGQTIDHADKYLGMLGKDSADDAEVAHKLIANHWQATSRELEKLGQEAKVPEIKETYFRMAKASEQKAMGDLESYYAQRLAEQRAAAAARASAEAARAKQDAEAPMRALAAAKTAAETDKLSAEAAKLRSEAAAPSETGEIYPGYEQTRKLTAGSEVKANTIYSAGASIKADLARLAEMREKNKGGTWDRNDVSEAKAIMNTLPSRYSQMFGSGAPNNTELELFGSYLTDPTDYQMTGLDPIESYRRLADQVDRTAEAQLAAYGINRVHRPIASYTPDAPAQAQAAQPPAPQRITMYAPDGSPMPVKPELAEQFKAHGFALEPPPKASPVAELSNAAYEDLARKESGY